MKKYKNQQIHSEGYLPSNTEIQQINLRGIKDRQVFEWLIFSSRGKATMELIRDILHLPKNGIKPINDYTFTRLEDLPNFPKNSDVSWERLNQYTRQLINLLQLSGRFFESVKSFVLFGRAVPAAPPVRVVITGLPPQQELLLEIYPEATFRDIRATWHTVVLMQGKLPQSNDKKHKNKWHIEAPVRALLKENVVSVKVCTDTVLEDLNNKAFRNELKRAFEQLGIEKTPYRAWNIKMGLKLQMLDAHKNLSDEERAQELFNSGLPQDNLQKVRRIRYKSKRK